MAAGLPGRTRAGLAAAGPAVHSLPPGAGGRRGRSGRPVAARRGDRGRGRRGRPGGQALRNLADALADGPAALSAGAPPVAGRLAAELIARGSATLTVPACAVCGRTGKPLFRGDDGGGVCQRCRAWQLARPCAACGKARPAAGIDKDGQAVCEVCRRRDDPRRHRACGRCGKTAPVAVRGRDGQPDICGTATGCPRPPAATAAAPPVRRSGRPASRSALVHAAGHRRLRAVRGRTGRRKPAGPKDRSATRVTPRPCATEGRARAAGSSGGWSPRPARR